MIALTITSCGLIGGGNTITGTVFLTDTDGGMGGWDDCEGQGGYSDLSAGAFVNAKNEVGTVVGATSLENLNDDNLHILVDDEDADGGDFSTIEDIQENIRAFRDIICIFAFELEVDDADVYVIQVGRRGDITYTKPQLETSDWEISLTIGDDLLSG